jgi:hypothetical protein
LWRGNRVRHGDKLTPFGPHNERQHFDMDTSTFWTMISAIATAASAVVIAVQSIQTKKSVEEARRSADASERAVTAANASLELNRQQTRHAELMAAEAIRSRMEVQAPAVSVRYSDFGEDGQPEPFGYVLGETFDAPTMVEIHPGHEFWEPRNDDQWVFAVMRVAFVNKSQSPVTITGSPMFTSWANGQVSDRVSSIHLSGAGQQGNDTKGVFVLVGGRLSQWFWVTKSQDRTHLDGGSMGWGTELDGETGIQVSQVFKIKGTLLKHGQEKGQYVLRGFGPDANYPSRFEAEKQKRHYFVGSDGNGGLRALPEIKLDGAALN